MLTRIVLSLPLLAISAFGTDSYTADRSMVSDVGFPSETPPPDALMLNAGGYTIVGPGSQVIATRGTSMTINNGGPAPIVASNFAGGNVNYLVMNKSTSATLPLRGVGTVKIFTLGYATGTYTFQ